MMILRDCGVGTRQNIHVHVQCSGFKWKVNHRYVDALLPLSNKSLPCWLLFPIVLYIYFCCLFMPDGVTCVIWSKCCSFFYQLQCVCPYERKKKYLGERMLLSSFL